MRNLKFTNNGLMYASDVCVLISPLRHQPGNHRVGLITVTIVMYACHCMSRGCVYMFRGSGFRGDCLHGPISGRAQSICMHVCIKGSGSRVTAHVHTEPSVGVLRQSLCMYVTCVYEMLEEVVSRVTAYGAISGRSLCMYVMCVCLFV